MRSCRWLDVTDEGQTVFAVEAAVARLGCIDFLVNNAGRGLIGQCMSGIDEADLDKVAFARAAAGVLTSRTNSPVGGADIEKARQNFTTLPSQLALHQREAERAESGDKISSRTNRAKREFTELTHPYQARKEDVSTLTEEISS